MASSRTLPRQLVITLLAAYAVAGAVLATVFWLAWGDALVSGATPAAAATEGRRPSWAMLMTGMTAGLAVVGAAAAWIVARRWSREVDALAAMTARLTGGGYQRRLDLPRRPELAALAGSLNALLDDVSARLAQLQAHRNELQAIVQSIGSGVLAMDGEQRLLSINRAAERMLGLQAATARGRLLQEVVRQPMLHQFVEGAIRGPAESRDEFELEGGPPRRVQAVGEPLQGAANRRAGLVLVLTDVTELKRLETIRSEFAANVSHELRTPITNISGYVETLLHAGSIDAAQSREFLQVIKRNADRLGAIIEDLLSLARLEQPESRAWLEPQPTPVRRLVAAAVAQFDAGATEKDIAVVIDVPDALVVPVNARLVEQAIANLLSNAIKYSPAGTTVRISGRPAGGNMAEIAVADEGSGIDARHLPRIFERFYRVDRARSRQLGGTGLGLAIVKHIAQVHGGRVEVHSTPGRGSTFRLLLPMT